MFGIVLAVATLLAPLSAAPVPPAQAQDLGPTAASALVTASLVLKVRNPSALEADVEATQTPGTPGFRRFLSVPEFVQRFAPSQQDISIITQYLAGFGITVTDVYADHLVIKATGTAAAFDQAFSVDLHDYTRDGRYFHRPRRRPRIPVLLRDLLVAVAGLSNEAQFHPMHVNANATASVPLRLAQPTLPPSGATATGVPGSYTVGDVANLYDINPLYHAHIDGAGRTIGIATLANFDPADAFTYWNLIGLNVDPNRLTQVHVDGGGQLSAAAGSDETALDVEQSGGIAPGARIIVYDAPNTDAGFLDLFYRAASDNLVDSLSTSWGSSEVWYLPDNQGQGDYTAELVAFHQAFLEMAAQGISTFASSGDSGAYAMNDAFNDPVDNVLSVDAPASDPAITAAGGTTTPVVLSAGPGTPDLVVSQEQVWGWDYIQNYLIQLFGPTFDNALFPIGGGGGVSVFWPRPAYQNGTPGIRRSEPGQSVVVGGVDTLDLPAHFPGRNLPDVALDADPYSGFLIYSSVSGGLSNGWGGTSFVAPQLNGVSALLEQVIHGRVGLWNPMLYSFRNVHGSRGRSPLVDITAGDNWFYYGVPGYEPGAGLGVLDVANLAAAVAREDEQGSRSRP
ncbi:MAG TPA: S53 family peptidase [Vicinamibacterales bacterium]|nr:S53 family peptidase [Vicinamibacterales bacterium]